MITDDFVFENQERFSLQLVDLGGSFSLPENFVSDPDMTEIIIQDNDEGERPTIAGMHASMDARLAT